MGDLMQSQGMPNAKLVVPRGHYRIPRGDVFLSFFFFCVTTGASALYRQFSFLTCSSCLCDLLLPYSHRCAPFL